MLAEGEDKEKTQERKTVEELPKAKEGEQSRKPTYSVTYPTFCNPIPMKKETYTGVYLSTASAIKQESDRARCVKKA